MSEPGSLYEQDWYAWTQDQAARLRAWPEHLRPNGLDVGNLAEEVEDMGGAQRQALASFLRLIALHLLKLEFHPVAEARLHWMAEVDNFRASVEQILEESPSLRPRRADLLPRAWQKAERDFRRQLTREFPERARILAAALPADAPPRYDLNAQLLAEGWYPEPFTG